MENTTFRALNAKSPIKPDGTPNWIYFNWFEFSKKGTIVAKKGYRLCKIIKESLESNKNSSTTNPVFTKVKTIIVVRKDEPMKAYPAFIANPISMGIGTKSYQFVHSRAFLEVDCFRMPLDELLNHSDYIVIE